MKVAEKHIRHYNHLNGKSITRKQLERVRTSLKKDLDGKRIDTSSPLGSECVKILARIDSAIPKLNGKPMRVNLQVVDVDKLKKAESVKAKKFGDVVPVVKSETTRVSTANGERFIKPGSRTPEQPKSIQGAKPKFQVIELDPPYKADFGKLYSDTQMMVWGLPGSGKTVYLLKLAKYQAEKKKLPVAYIAAEEYGRSTFDEKLQMIFGVSSIEDFKHPMITIKKSLAEIPNIDAYRVLFCDSVNKMKWSVDDWTEFADRHPNMIKIAIIQTTKDGDFKGGQEWQHEMDIAGEIRNRKIIIRKNRLDPEFSVKRDKLLLEDRIKQKQEKLLITEKVRERIAPPQVQIASFQPETII